MDHSEQTIGVGLIGFGLGGRVFHAPFVEATDGLELRAVVSSDAAKVQATLPGMTVAPDVDALLALPGIDLVIVSSPDHLHAQHAITALEMGKHVLVDKPFATNLADARRVAEAAERAGRMLTVFHNRRWDADFLTLKRLIDEEKLGRIANFESHFDRWRPEAAPIWKEAREGGSWTDLGPHLVDQAICLFGKPQAVTCSLATLRDAAPSPDWFLAILHYPHFRAVLQSSKVTANHSLRLAVHGTRGSWIKHGLDTQEPAIVGGASPSDDDFGLDPEPGYFTDGNDPAHQTAVPNERGDYRQFWCLLEAALRGMGPNPVPIQEALDVMEVLEAGMQSSRDGATVVFADQQA